MIILSTQYINWNSSVQDVVHIGTKRYITAVS